jgi:lysylphosphatidylglycerol synthetase-like protein (DUF2156 family)
MNVMMSRLIWIASRIERLEEKLSGDCEDQDFAECIRLRKRRRLAQRAILLSTAAALTICVVIALLFLSAITKAAIGTVIALAWIIAMSSLIGGLLCFALEARCAIRDQVIKAEILSREE